MEAPAKSSDQLLDQYLPTWHFNEVHRREVRAPAGFIRDALLTVTPRDVPFSGFLLALRLAPAAIASRRWPLPPDRPWLELLAEMGFVELGRTDEEIAFGAIGQFWRLREQLEPIVDALAFRQFDRPGFAKGAMNFRIEVRSGSATLATETRVWATDEQALRRFRAYWVPVRAFGGLMRRELLQAVAKRAERQTEAN
jgi:hypothetical protein